MPCLLELNSGEHHLYRLPTVLEEPMELAALRMKEVVGGLPRLEVEVLQMKVEEALRTVVVVVEEEPQK
jgi:hypothetical protein